MPWYEFPLDYHVHDILGDVMRNLWEFKEYVQKTYLSSIIPYVKNTVWITYIEIKINGMYLS